MLETKLKKIFENYKNIYHLETILYLEHRSQCVFNTEGNFISYDTDWLKDKTIYGLSNTQPIKEKLIFTLLCLIYSKK